RALLSDHIALEKRRLLEDALEAEALEIDGAVLPMDDELSNGIAGSRPLLQAVAGKAIGEEEIRNLRMRPDDGILVEGVIVIVADPGIDDLDRLESGDTGGERLPDVLLEPAILDFPVHFLGLVGFFGRQAANELRTFGTEINAGDIDGEWRLVQRCAGARAIEHIDIALAGTDRELDARHAGERAGSGSA